MLGNTLYLSTVTLEIFTIIISFSKCAMKQIYFFFKPTSLKRCYKILTVCTENCYRYFENSLNFHLMWDIPFFTLQSPVNGISHSPLNGEK